MDAITTRSFKSGNSVAVRLPAELGIAAGTEFTIRRMGRELRIVPTDEEAEGRARMVRLVEALDAIGPVDPSALTDYDREEERIEFPDRPGLY